MNTLSRTLAAALFGLSIQTGLAQQDSAENTEGNWYRVHLAVFAHRSESAEHEELWRNQLQLKYPRNLIRLKTRERYLADLCGLSSSTERSPGTNRLLDILEQVDSGDGYRPEDFPEPPPASAANLDPACREVRPDLFPPDAAEIAKDKADAIVASAESVLSNNKTPAAGETSPELTSYILSQQIDDEEFANLVKKLNAAYRYRMLFSGSWLQALQPRKQANALLIEGGDAVGQHHELEGYIRVGLERYLHIDTDLWLSQFSTLRRASTSFDEAPQHQIQLEGVQAEPQRLSEFPALPIPFPVNDPRYDGEKPPVESSAEAEAYGQSQADTAQDNFRPSSNLDVLAAEDSSYFVNRTVVMRENRRMRSGEVHYLDHPMFGVLIKITPIAKPGADNSQASTVSQR